jgi:hypothetical protein
LGWNEVTGVEFELVAVSKANVPTVVLGVKKGPLGNIGRLSHSYPTESEAREVVANIDSLRNVINGEQA